MSYRIVIDPRLALLITYIDGTLTVADAEAAIAEAVADPAFDPSFDHLSLGAETADLSAMTPEVIRSFVETFDRYVTTHPKYTGQPTRTAHVGRNTTHDPVIRLIAAVYELHAEADEEVRSFETLEEAAAWLERDPAALRPYLPD